MKMAYDRQLDVAYIRLANGPVTETKEVAPGIVMPFFRQRRVVPLVLASWTVKVTGEPWRSSGCRAGR